MYSPADSAENLSSAALLSANMEALLETEDDELASWDADRLMLEIDDALSDATASSSDRTLTLSPRDLTTTSPDTGGDLPDSIHRVKRGGKDSSAGSTSAKHLCRSDSLPTSLETDEFGMPLAIFTKVYNDLIFFVFF